MARRSEPNELRITRVYDAPVRAVWDAWTELDQVSQWWGPRGFTITTHSKDLREGGTWRYTMHGPDGVDYPNVTRYLVVEPLRKLVYDHGGTDDRPPLFRVTVTFEESDGRTTMDMIMALATPELAASTAVFVKKAGGNGTWDRLAEHLESTVSGRAAFILHRSFEAAPERVFEMFADPVHLARWLPPAGHTMHFVRPSIAVGRSTLFVLSGAEGQMRVRCEYRVIDAPRLIVYAQQFVDDDELPVVPFGAAAWPLTLLNTVTFTDEGAGWTRVRVMTEAIGETSPAALAAFVAERGGMTAGWSASFDALEELLIG